MVRYIPERGDLVWLDFSPQSGHEQAGRRPALVLSPSRYNAASGRMLACPITSRRKGYPFEVEMPRECSIAGVALADQVRTLDWRSRNAAFIEEGGEDVVEETVSRIAPLLGW